MMDARPFIVYCLLFAISYNMNNFIPRPSQQQILEYSGGRLGIVDVPGAGKTHIISVLALRSAAWMFFNNIIKFNREDI